MSDIYPERVGFVGAGRMAQPMIRRLAAHGKHEIGVYDRDPAATERLTGLPSVTVHRDPGSLFEASELAILSLPGPAAVEGTVSELLAGRTPERLTIVNTSTSGIVTSKKCAERLAGTGVQLVDAPVSGGMVAAERGALTFIVSGPAEAVRTARPVLELLGEHLFDVGREPGLAQAVKSANNMLGLSALLATAEAAVVLTRLGVDLAQAIDVFNASSGRNSATLEKFPREVLTGRFDFGFSFASVVKDLSLFLEAARDAGLDPAVATHAHAAWQQAAEDGYADLDCTRVVQYVAGDLGAESTVD
ncbi:NAD(P)-dependent oxidoreductase [Amycolatopsis granulosa]|uniref:NAD(P)-dependent oxidoreductase n=1 Tax=Amycolatopsis granulosa TaxID=185684 RepID=UPI00141DFA30|nr:NAD(P)-dependent oxidoreductase [Amycolatopsis granulosa]NIH83361.1 3-hydroxyisobutyrate dehydrogenase [Amycolatopsis granulosa]